MSGGLRTNLTRALTRHLNWAKFSAYGRPGKKRKSFVKRNVQKDTWISDFALCGRQSEWPGKAFSRQEQRRDACWQQVKLLQTLLVGQVRPAIPELIRCRCKLSGHFDSALELIMQTTAQPGSYKAMNAPRLTAFF